MRWWDEMREDHQANMKAGLIAGALTLPAAYAAMRLMHIWITSLRGLFI